MCLCICPKGLETNQSRSKNSVILERFKGLSTLRMMKFFLALAWHNLESPRKRLPGLRNFQSRQAWGQTWKIFLSDDWCRRTPPTTARSIPREKVLHCMRKLAEWEPLGSPPIMLLHSSCLQTPVLSSLTPVTTRLWYESVSRIFFPPQDALWQSVLSQKQKKQTNKSPKS